MMTRFVQIVAVALMAIAVGKPAAAAGYGTFADCLRSSGAVMYGASWCHVCRTQRKGFRGYANRLSYVDCSIPGSKKTRAKCKSLGIDSFPTWIFGDGSKREGKMSMSALASQTGCPLPD